MNAKDYGVTLEEAVRRLRLQNALPRLEPELRKKEADTFAGLWIQHEPDLRLVVLFTRDGEKTIQPYIDDEVSSRRDLVIPPWNILPKADMGVWWRPGCADRRSAGARR